MDFLSLISAVPALIHSFQGKESAPYRGEQEALASRQAQYADAMAHPESQMYQDIYKQYSQKNKYNIAEVIAEAQRQNRMNSRNGRTPLFSQDRGGEQLFRAMMQQYQGADVAANEAARTNLQSAAGLNRDASNTYIGITPTTARANAQQLSGYSGVSDLLKQFMGQQPSTGSQGGGNYSEGINWSTPRIDPSKYYMGGSY